MAKKFIGNKDLMEIKEKLRLVNDKQLVVANAIGITEVYLSYILNGERPLSEHIKEMLKNYLDHRLANKRQWEKKYQSIMNSEIITKKEKKS